MIEIVYPGTTARSSCTRREDECVDKESFHGARKSGITLT